MIFQMNSTILQSVYHVHYNSDLETIYQYIISRKITEQIQDFKSYITEYIRKYNIFFV